MDKIDEVQIKTEPLWLEDLKTLPEMGFDPVIKAENIKVEENDTDLSDVVELETTATLASVCDYKPECFPGHNDDGVKKIDLYEETVELKITSALTSRGDYQSIALSDHCSHDNKLQSSAANSCTSVDCETRVSKHNEEISYIIKKENVPEEHIMVETVPFESVWICKEEVKDENNEVPECESTTCPAPLCLNQPVAVPDQCGSDNVVQVENWQTTRSGGGAVCTFTGFNNIVLDKAGKQPCLTTSPGVAETWEEPPTSGCSSITRENTTPGQRSVRCVDFTRTNLFSGKDKATKRKTSLRELELTADLVQAKRKLQLEYLKLENYKTKLEVRKLELKLGLPLSKFTSDLGSCKL